MVYNDGGNVFMGEWRFPRGKKSRIQTTAGPEHVLSITTYAISLDAVETSKTSDGRLNPTKAKSINYILINIRFGLGSWRFSAFNFRVYPECGMYFSAWNEY